MNGAGWFSPLVGWGLAAAVLLFWAVGAYNRLVRLRAKVLSIFGTLVQHFERYAQWVAAQAPEPPAERARSGDRWASLRAASAQFTASLAAARAKPMDVRTIAGLSAARTVLWMAWQQLDEVTLAQARGEPGAGEPRAAWEAITTQTQSIDKALTAAVQAYNQAVRQFPAILLAWIFGFRPAPNL